MAHHSMALLNMPVEFINVKPLNPLISSCDIKVLYTGKNRNRSYISKAVGENMAHSLPNVPIVGEFLEQIGDYGDHAEELVIDSKGVRFRKRTVPYGAVPADTKIWWQWFHDDDGVDREYLMCTGYLWTGRYPEANRILEKGNGQSMELDKETLQGQWATLQNEVNEYFIIDEAIFSALCILGENVEPCFESASITAPNVVYSLNKDEFRTEMTQFMLDLKNALNSQGGGEEMSKPVTDAVVEDNKDQDTNPAADTDFSDKSGQGDVNDNDNNVDNGEEQKPEDDFAKKKPEDEDKKDENKPEGEDPENKDSKDPNKKEDDKGSDDEEDKKKKKPSYTLEEVTEYQELLTQYQELETKYNAIVAEYEEIKPEFTRLQKLEADSIKVAKEKMIAKFSALDKSDIADVEAKIDTYSLDEIEAKLSVIAVRKGVNFSLENAVKTENPMSTEDPIVSFYANSNPNDGVPAWIKAVEARKRK